MKLLKFASIDVGSNAIRLLFTNVFETPEGPVFRKNSLVRVPIRLGEDAFVHGRIQDEKSDQLVQTMRSFRHLMDVHQVHDYRAFATSAMREAENADEVVKAIKVFADIDLEVVSGDIEAATISTDSIPSHLPQFEEAVFIDVGGGSTEMTLLRDHQKVDSISLKIGTIRLLHDVVKQEMWDEFFNWFKINDLIDSDVPIIGTGGNINKLLKVLREDSTDYFIKTRRLANFKEELNEVDIDERIVKFILNPDRADVIVPASTIFIKAAEYMDTSRIYIPKAGLSDGIARSLYEKYKAENDGA